MVFIKAHRKQLFLAGSLAAAVTAFTVTERYPKLPFLKPLTCDDAGEMPGFG